VTPPISFSEQQALHGAITPVIARVVTGERGGWYVYSVGVNSTDKRLIEVILLPADVLRELVRT
jgi:hypothetical protein